MSERRVVEFGATRYEFVEDAQGGHWWPDVTPQERVLVEELERQQVGMRQLLAERAQAAAIATALYEAIGELDDRVPGGLYLAIGPCPALETAIEAYEQAFPRKERES